MSCSHYENILCALRYRGSSMRYIHKEGGSNASLQTTVELREG